MKFIFSDALALLVVHFFGLHVLSFCRHLRFAVEGVQKHEEKHGGNELWPFGHSVTGPASWFLGRPLTSGVLRSTNNLDFTHILTPNRNHYDFTFGQCMNCAKFYLE